jgi:parallel beta-helix repeat protein/predicted outer membrane repeat protein
MGFPFSHTYYINIVAPSNGAFSVRISHEVVKGNEPGKTSTNFIHQKEVTLRDCVLLLTFLFLLVFTSTTHAVTVYVPDDFDTIQTALDACADGDTVIVRDGTYTGDGNRDIYFTGKAIVLMSENGPEVTIIDCEGSPSAWRRGFYFVSGEDLNTVVQGFTITNGYQTYGGGIYCNVSSPTITGNIIVGNTATSYGGGIYCGSCSPTITGNTIEGNTANEDGGGIECWPSASATITGNVITGNTAAGNGGGVDCWFGSDAFIAGNTISQNTADWGGGILSYSCTPTVTNNTIEGNVTISGAGAGLHSLSSDIIIAGNTVTGNMSGTGTPAGGGGLSVQLGTSIIENNIISGNTATGAAGGFFLWYDNSTVSNNLITSNVADTLGAGGIGFFYSSATLYNNTITGNSVNGEGGGVWLADSSTVNIINTISWNNTATTGNEIAIGYIASSTPSTLTISYSDVEGGEGGVFVDSGCTLNWGDGMIDDDPLFMTFKGYDYLLDVDSPCIDTGDPTIEDGISDWHPRWPDWLPNGPESDMGAYGGPGNKGWVK